MTTARNSIDTIQDITSVVSPGQLKRQEYTICLDTRSRDKNCYPHANDVVLPVNFSRGLPVERISLGSVELPLPQYIVEEVWSQIYFSEGLALIVNSESEECLREFNVQEFDGTLLEVKLPIWLNPIIDIDLTTPSEPIFTTEFEHGLELYMDLWDWGSPIELISTVLTDPAFTNLNSSNVNLVILDENRFQLLNVVPAIAATGGYVHAPSIANPEKLANMITFGLNSLSSNFTYSMIFDGTKNQFCLKITILSCEYKTSAMMSVAPATIIVPNSANCLANIMGFGCTNLPLPRDEICNEGSCGKFCYQCMSYFKITPGNYNVETFPPQFYLQANRFYFEPTCLPTGTALPPPTLIFSDECGECHEVIIPFGYYSPESLAETLQTTMNTFSATSDYVVTFNQDENTFTFSTVSGRPFGLEFEDTRNIGFGFANGNMIEVPFYARLGFSAVNYRGGNSYTSTFPFHLPVKTCKCSNIPERLLSNTYSPILNRAQKKFGINAGRPRIAAGIATDIGGGILEVNTFLNPVPPAPIPPEYAHGFQPEDVVKIYDPLANETYKLVVSEVVSAITFRAEIQGVTPLETATDLAVCTCLNDPVILNLFFGIICNNLAFMESTIPTNAIKAEITGFNPTARLWTSPTSLPMFGENQFNLDPPDYLLIQLVKPSKSTYIQHTFGEHTITNVFAKLSVYPALRVERATPMETILQGLAVINQMQFRILNPDHRLYNFHGRDWSITLIFIIAGLTGYQMLY